MNDSSPERDWSVEIKDASATRGTTAKDGQRCVDSPLVNLRIRIHEEKDLAARQARTGIAHGGDLPMLDASRSDLHLFDNPRSSICGRVIHHDHLIRLGYLVHRRTDAVQALANPTLLVMGWDNEGKHGGRWTQTNRTFV
jgi:hypothetical protein